MQYTVILTAVKMIIFKLKNDIFPIFSQNIDRGYTHDLLLEQNIFAYKSQFYNIKMVQGGMNHTDLLS